MLPAGSSALTPRWPGREADDRGDAIGGKAYASGMFLNGRLVRGEVDAIHLVAGYVAMEPLDLGTHSPQNVDRLLETSRN